MVVATEEERGGAGRRGAARGARDGDDGPAATATAHGATAERGTAEQLPSCAPPPLPRRLLLRQAGQPRRQEEHGLPKTVHLEEYARDQSPELCFGEMVLPP